MDEVALLSSISCQIANFTHEGQHQVKVDDEKKKTLKWYQPPEKFGRETPNSSAGAIFPLATHKI